MNPLDYGIWGAIEKKVWRTKILDMDQLKAEIVKTWNEYPQDSIDRAIDSFRKRLKLVIEAEGGIIECYL